MKKPKIVWRGMPNESCHATFKGMSAFAGRKGKVIWRCVVTTSKNEYLFMSELDGIHTFCEKSSRLLCELVMRAHAK